MDALQLLKGRGCGRLGVLGGSFDPVHMGHLVVAQEALHQFHLDHVVLMPTGTPPHKREILTAGELRYLMANMATASHERLWVSRLELERGGTHYTVDTMSYLRDFMPPATELFFITGADAVLEILTWKEPERLLSLASLIAASRPGHDLAGLSQIAQSLEGGDRISAMEIPGLAVSSSMIRERRRAGEPIRYLVPECVAEFMDKWGLYLTPGGG